MAKYKIKRGNYIRREGEKREFKSYGPGMDVEMSDAEANAFGRSRLVSGGGVQLPTAADVANAEASRVGEAPPIAPATTPGRIRRTR